MFRTCEEKHDFSKNKFQICDCPRSKKCLKQIKLLISLHTCAPISELPSNISTMAWMHTFLSENNSNLIILEVCDYKGIHSIYFGCWSGSVSREKSDPDPTFKKNRIRIRPSSKTESWSEFDPRKKNLYRTKLIGTIAILSIQYASHWYRII